MRFSKAEGSRKRTETSTKKEKNCYLGDEERLISIQGSLTLHSYDITLNLKVFKSQLGLIHWSEMIYNVSVKLSNTEKWGFNIFLRKIILGMTLWLPG